jgi:hypothetical protein
MRIASKDPRSGFGKVSEISLTKQSKLSNLSNRTIVEKVLGFIPCGGLISFAISINTVS